MFHYLRKTFIFALLVTTVAAGKHNPNCNDCPGRMDGCLKVSYGPSSPPLFASSKSVSVLTNSVQGCEGGVLCWHECECRLSKVDEFCREKCGYNCDKPI